MAEMKTYAGACHCGQVQYEAQTDLAQVVSCNCSICSKRGLLLTFVPPEQFKPVAGVDSQKLYQFNKKVIDHLFCPTCGVESYGTGKGPDGKQMYAINVRCLDGVDVSTLTPMPFNGRDR
ncbi:GFA family protein [Corallococcus llansteffanensis]|uniref:GFA family protein n=1 Tax=Corallococcus llansteffanensis TaxID=2316731 RepID=A0A3A8Q2I3_9BACT|nr:GFA family protein [Corallococcus llansteffanensis]RKH62873.1 GFA family protein [Corallococcus llansteffanensis]